MTTSNDFLPDNYEIPVEQKYFKTQQGENRIRILGRPIIGWLDWKDKKPIRFRMDEKPEAPVDANKPIRHFWAFVVWNYTLERLQVAEVTQQTIQKAIKTLSIDPEWGDPSAYDIKISKEGDGRDTEYGIVAVPPKPLMPEIVELYEKAAVNLDRLFDGKDPFTKGEA